MGGLGKIEVPVPGASQPYCPALRVRRKVAAEVVPGHMPH